jgi:uncharacterized protein YcbK (DUF882 family)
MAIAKSNWPAEIAGARFRHRLPTETDTLTLPRALAASLTILSRRLPAALAFAAIAGLCLLSPAHGSGAAPAAGGDLTAATAAHPGAQRYELHLHHLHTGEDLDVVYRVGDEYIPSAIATLNHFLRDHRTQDTANYDPKEFDVLHSVLSRLGRPNATIDVVCGYRTPWSNGFLRTRGGTVAPAQTGVAEHSQHMLSKAIDIRIPGITTAALRNAALSLHAGGVGYYPISQFVHVDVGPVRQWSFGGR